MKLALARKPADAIARFDEILGPLGFLATFLDDGTLYLQAPDGTEFPLHSEDALASLPAAFEPLRAALKQIFRIGSAA